MQITQLIQRSRDISAPSAQKEQSAPSAPPSGTAPSAPPTETAPSASPQEPVPRAPSGHEGAEGGEDSWALLAGAAVAVGGVGALLALADVDSVLRAPFTLFFLLVAPAAAIAAALPRLDPLSRTVIAVIGAMAVDLLVAEVMIAARLWSSRGGVLAIGALSVAVLLVSLARHRGTGGRMNRGG